MNIWFYLNKRNKLNENIMSQTTMSNKKINKKSKMKIKGK